MENWKIKKPLIYCLVSFVADRGIVGEIQGHVREFK